ncbi:alpha/beta hydrolase [Xylanimonas protaetiae]|uniref:Alpha/beta hydrolase n=1 Tax=Xylanimonas protaetiae TaxID=2509457 RepID=A0A4V0YG15_9MICO|nr:alpha/beta hydrolase [Xylanimonas protaetiae]QAY69631.1 hypothetical protein ET471_05920 [Xylanimonas protaetiae]
MRVFVHGAGRSGREAWPRQSDDDAVFLDLTTVSTMEEKVDVVAAAVPSQGCTVVAHSAGAVPVLLAVKAGAAMPHALVLLEPALYDVARGAAPVEAHIATMSTARERAAQGDLLGFWTIVRPLMFGGPFDVDQWPAERATAEHIAAVEPPWGHGLAASDIDGTPTVVVTGAWNEEYEAIAAALAWRGARHAQMPGHGHRPQDHPDFGQLLDGWMF